MEDPWYQSSLLQCLDGRVVSSDGACCKGECVSASLAFHAPQTAAASEGQLHASSSDRHRQPPGPACAIPAIDLVLACLGCAAGLLIDAQGQCCEAAHVDACGVCDGDGTAIDATGGRSAR